MGRKDKVHASEIDYSDESWEEIRSHLDKETRQRTTKGEPELRRTSKRDSLDSNMSSRKRASSHNSLSPHESGASIRRPTDMFQPAKSRCKNEHIRDLPPCLRQTCHRATDPPLSLKFDPALLHDATKQRDDMDKVADVLLTLQGGNTGNVEVDHSNLVERTIFALRGFGGFQLRRGIGAYGKEMNARLRRMPAYGKEEIPASGARRFLTNRISYGFSTLKLGTFSRGEEGNKTATLADFTPVTVEEMENHYLTNADMEPVGRYTFSLDFFKRSIRNQNSIWSMVFGV